MFWRFLILLACVLSFGCQNQPKEQVFEFTTGPLGVEVGQTSMVGSEDRRWLRLTGGAEFIWITGFEVEVLDEQATEPVATEFLCHTSLDVVPEQYQASVAPNVNTSARMFTLSQGITKVRFPEGFALPFHTRHPLAFQTQVLNLNERESRQTRHRIKISYLSDRDLKKRPKALFLIRAPVLKSANPEGATFGEAVGASACSGGENANPTGYIEKDADGEVFFSHWRLPPGRDKSKTLITEKLALEKEVTCHYIISHVHPTAESLELLDITEMSPLFRCEVKSTAEGLGIEELPVYSSTEGFVLKPDHEYGLVSVYQNDSGKTLDAMAVMYLYLHDPDYEPPSKVELELPLPPGAKLVERTPTKVNYTIPLAAGLCAEFFREALKESWKPQDGEPATWFQGETKLSIRSVSNSECSLIIER